MLCLHQFFRLFWKSIPSLATTFKISGAPYGAPFLILGGGWARPFAGCIASWGTRLWLELRAELFWGLPAMSPLGLGDTV